MESERHRGKVVFITGAGSGIGRETACRFAREGAARIYLVDRFADRLASVATEVRAHGASVGTIQAELADASECERALHEAHGESQRLDVVISNAATYSPREFVRMDTPAWNQAVAVILTASFVIGRGAAQVMIERGGGGVILYTASISSLGASRSLAHYCAAKAAVVNLVKTMAVELAGYGIRVNAVSPGPTDTPQSVNRAGEEQMRRWRQDGFPLVPLGRLGRPADVAAAFSYLASTDAGYVSGINLVVDGGLTAGLYPASSPSALPV